MALRSPRAYGEMKGRVGEVSQGTVVMYGKEVKMVALSCDWEQQQQRLTPTGDAREAQQPRRSLWPIEE
jgi:hypothetical protein